MKATELLKQDHSRVDKLFKRVENTTPSEHPAIFKQIKAELDVHTHIEETIFYPELLKKGKKDLKDITREGIEEHGQAKMFLEELSKMTARNKQYEAKLKVLMEDIEHHVKEEEDEMFPLVEDQLSATANEKLGVAMEQEKVKFIETLLPAEKKALQASLAYAENDKGALQKMLEKAKDMAASMMGSEEKNGKAKASKPTSAKSADGKAKKPAAKARKPSSPSAMKSSLRKTQAARANK